MQRLPHLVGDQRARELTYTGRTFSGALASSYGLALEAYESGQALRAGVSEVARMIAAKSPLTVRGIKQVSLHMAVGTRYIRSSYNAWHTHVTGGAIYSTVT